MQNVPFSGAFLDSGMAHLPINLDIARNRADWFCQISKAARKIAFCMIFKEPLKSQVSTIAKSLRRHSCSHPGHKTSNYYIFTRENLYPSEHRARTYICIYLLPLAERILQLLKKLIDFKNRWFKYKQRPHML